MPIPFLNLQAQYQSIKHEVDAAMQHVLDSSAYVLGPAVEQFEHEFAQYCQTEHCIAVNSGTSALSILLQCYGIGAGDEVITVANSFFASAEAISEVGATPILVDCHPDTALIDVSALRNAITGKTKAIIPVHLYGQCADMDAIMQLADMHNLIVIEDACQAHGARYKGKRAGSLGHAAAFSFYPGKNLGAYGEGGAITTNDTDVAQRARSLRAHGELERYTHKHIGWNERMDGLQGAVLSVKLKHLDAWNTRRREVAALYRELLPSSYVCMQEVPDNEHVYHLFVIRHKEREALKNYLAEKEIATAIHYPIPIHLQPAYEGRWKQGAFPHAEKLSSEILSLPIYAELTDDQVREVCRAIADFERTRGGNV